MTGVAEPRDRPGASQEQVAADQMRKAEIGAVSDKLVDIFQRGIQLPPLNFLENPLQLRVSSVEARAVPRLGREADGRSEHENKSDEQRYEAGEAGAQYRTRSAGAWGRSG